MHTAYIGIGSNLGDRARNIRTALMLLEQKGVRVLKLSSLHETGPWGVEDQPGFLNAAARVETESDPEGLLKALLETESELGRTRGQKWGPRTIDLDILLFNGLALDTPALKVPHPLMHEREFVLAPLAEIAPEAVHPVLKKKIKELLQAVRG